MKKLDSLMQILEQLVPADTLNVFCPEGKINKSAPRDLSFKNVYVAAIFINKFTGDANLLFAYITRWISTHEPKNSGPQFEFEVYQERETEAFICIEIELTENVHVIEDGNGGLIVDVC